MKKNALLLIISLFIVINVNSQNYVISTTIIPNEGGIVTGAGTYEYGDIATITATSNFGYKFSCMYDDAQCIGDSVWEYDVISNKNITIEFIKLEYEINVDVNINEGGYTTGEGTYNYYDQVILQAFTNDGYKFNYWIDNQGNVLNIYETYIFNASKNLDITAYFEKTVDIEYKNESTIKIYPNPTYNFINIKNAKIGSIIFVTDLQGKILIKTKIEKLNSKIDVSKIKDNIVLVKIEDKVEKVIIKR